MNASVFEVVSLALVFGLMVVLIRRKVDVSLALVAGAVALGVLFGIDWARLPRGVARALLGVGANLARVAVKPTFWELLGLVLLIQFLGHALRHVASLERLIAVLKTLLSDRRAAMAVAPAFVGLLPMPGGALFSAPMVGELTNDLDVPSEDRALINYWFRHIWEWTWPLYPGILFAAAIAQASLGKLILAQSPMTLAAIAIGVGFCFRRVRLPAHEGPKAPAGTWLEFLAAVWPVALVIVLTAALAALGRVTERLGVRGQTALLIALALVVPAFLASKRVPWRQVAHLVRATVTVQMVLLVFGVVAFGEMLGAYGAAEALPRIFADWGVPPLVLMFCVPYLVGLLTGYMPAVVGICFPLLVPLIVEATPAGRAIHYGRLVFAYAGGLLGVLSSPVHLCLVLSREYFKADFGLVYRRLALWLLLLALAGLGVMALWEAAGLR